MQIMFSSKNVEKAEYKLKFPPERWDMFYRKIIK